MISAAIVLSVDGLLTSCSNRESVSGYVSGVILLLVRLRAFHESPVWNSLLGANCRFSEYGGKIQYPSARRFPIKEERKVDPFPLRGIMILVRNGDDCLVRISKSPE